MALRFAADTHQPFVGISLFIKPAPSRSLRTHRSDSERADALPSSNEVLSFRAAVSIESAFAARTRAHLCIPHDPRALNPGGRFEPRVLAAILHECHE